MKREIKIDISPVADVVEKAGGAVGGAIDRGIAALRDFSLTPTAPDKFAVDENPYRAALFEILDALEAQENLSAEDARKLGPAKDKPPARIHQEGRAHAFRDARSIVLRHIPPERA